MGPLHFYDRRAIKKIKVVTKQRKGVGEGKQNNPRIKFLFDGYILCGLLFNLVYFSFLSTGRFGNGQGQEFAEHFLLEYWRESLAKWVRYKDIKGEEVCVLRYLPLSLILLRLSCSIISLFQINYFGIPLI